LFAVLASLFFSANAQDTCTTCEYVATGVEWGIKFEGWTNDTANVAYAQEVICVFPGITQVCDSIVQLYLSKFIDDITNGAAPQQCCADVGLCPSTKVKGKPNKENKEHKGKGKQEVKLGKVGKSELKDDKKLATRIADIVGASIERVRPITETMTRYLDSAHTAGTGNVDEQELVRNVRPLIEQATQILNETHGSIKALDPTGEISQHAKGAAQSHQASSEEYYLAQKLSDLTENVQKVIDKAKMTIQDMPHAKEELSPLLALLQEPLGQIISAVGLLLSGVVGLVRNLLDGLGLGGVLDSLLGSLGLGKVLDGVGDALGQGLKGLFPK